MAASFVASTFVKSEEINLERAFSSILSEDHHAEFYLEGLTGDVWDWFAEHSYKELDNTAIIEYTNYYHRKGVHVVGFYVKAWANDEFEGRISVLWSN